MNSQQPVVPVLSATILLVRDNPLEVLMVKRRSRSFYASALVFPGGGVEAADRAPAWATHIEGGAGLDAQARALRIAGVRETFEETGILLASGAASVATANQSFPDLVRSSRAALDLDALCPFGHWITPEGTPKRFDAHFFLARAPEGAEPVADGDEAVSVEWMQPGDALARVEVGEARILFPTLMNLKRLAESRDVVSAFAAARARPIVTVTPRVSRRDGVTILSIPEEAGYGLTEYASPPMDGPVRQEQSQ